MSARVVGRIASIHRYPVKSMGGEALERAEVTERGLAGDRAYALVDRETGRVVSAKRPRRWPGILAHRAALDVDGGDAASRLRIRLADGAAVTSDDVDELERRVSEALGRPVRLERSAAEGASFEYHWPDMEGLEYQGRTYRDEITEHATLEGTFFDSSWLHVLTTASLEHLHPLAPGADFAPARFRPNLVVEVTDGSRGLVENAWVGRTLRVGDVRLRVVAPCFRCVMVTLPQGDLPEDPRILRAAVEHNEGNVGVRASVAAGGEIRVGDPVVLEPSASSA